MKWNLQPEISDTFCGIKQTVKPKNVWVLGGVLIYTQIQNPKNVHTQTQKPKNRRNYRAFTELYFFFNFIYLKFLV
jgi:hypothetical protein